MMMIPPLVRVGPIPDTMIRPKKGFVVLLERRGWMIVKWSERGYFEDTERAIPRHLAAVHPSDILCWMPDDGS